MSEDLRDEIAALNAIYTPDTITPAHDPHVYILRLPDSQVALRVRLDDAYPVDSTACVLGVEKLGPESRKGEGTVIVSVANRYLELNASVGNVCLFDLIEHLGEHMQSVLSIEDAEADKSTKKSPAANSRACSIKDEGLTEKVKSSFQWYASEVVTEKRSSFVAHACSVDSPAAVQRALESLLTSDKRFAKATHNITAYRVRNSQNTAVTYQDCDDDGETAAGGRLLHLLQLMQAWDVLVVVSRWYGGVKLGPDRFRIVNAVARHALVAAGFTK